MPTEDDNFTLVVKKTKRRKTPATKPKEAVLEPARIVEILDDEVINTMESVSVVPADLTIRSSSSNGDGGKLEFTL